jgi:hypothetical protein
MTDWDKNWARRSGTDGGGTASCSGQGKVGSSSMVHGGEDRIARYILVRALEGWQTEPKGHCLQ